MKNESYADVRVVRTKAKIDWVSALTWLVGVPMISATFWGGIYLLAVR
jgi:hypothetical protein